MTHDQPHRGRAAVGGSHAMPEAGTAAHPAVLEAVFRRVIAWRWVIAGVYLALLVPSAFFALRVTQDNSIDRLIVENDPDSLDARAFADTFGHGEYVVLVAEAQDPFAPEALRRFDETARRLAQLPGVEVNSALGIYRRARAGFVPTDEQSGAFRRFALGTDLFRKQGLVSEHHLAMALIIDVHDTASRARALAAIDAAVAPVAASPAPFSAFRKVGEPYVNAYHDAETREAGLRYFPLFGLFVVLLNLLLYRSFRALAAFLVTLAASAALTMGYIGATGGVFTIVSSLVPMTVLITCTATLVYVHSRYVECPPDRDPADHHVFALANKFLACTASIFAGAVGFAALAVSKIRPIREMGIWVAVGLLITWVVVFTLFPALQRIFRTPMIRERRVAGRWFMRFSHELPVASHRLRFVLVPAALLLCGAGAVALFGFPGRIAPMQLETNPLEYMDHGTSLYRDTKRMEELGTGLSVTEVWLRGGRYGAVTDPAVLLGLQRFQTAVERDPRVTAVIGLPTIARTLRYVSGRGDGFPDDAEGLAAMSDQLEQLVGREPMLGRYIGRKTMGETHVSVLTRTVDYAAYQDLKKMIETRWAEARQADPALSGFRLTTTGLALLEAKIAHHLVPTLVQSFGLSVVIIYAAFLVVFRNGMARLMAMIPSFFAILVMFALMRLFHMTFNVATILVASTVLGTTENDQIHFFYHYLEKRREGSVEASLRYTMQVAGRAIFFATLINAGGFLAFTLARLPPIRQFGVLSALAFTLSMVADFTALPAGLWMVLRSRPGTPEAPEAGAGAQPGAGPDGDDNPAATAAAGRARGM